MTTMLLLLDMDTTGFTGTSPIMAMNRKKSQPATIKIWDTRAKLQQRIIWEAGLAYESTTQMNRMKG